jgi:hypothetical protein
MVDPLRALKRDEVTLNRLRSSLRGAQATKQSSYCNNLDCFALLAMTGLRQPQLIPR